MRSTEPADGKKDIEVPFRVMKTSLRCMEVCKAIAEDAGKPEMFACAEFFEAKLENDNTHVAYHYAVNRFLAWCEDQGVPLKDVQHLAGHADPLATRLYDRRKREVTRNIVERISI